ncbi:MAG: type I polyketide synthase, partial [Pseudonocardiaceae bacterium]
MVDTRVSPGGCDGAVAVIGYACRVPKAAGPDALWDLLRSGASGITGIPDDRPELRSLEEAAEGHPGLRWGGFVDDVDQFDAEFFGISPREAAAMDPTQRLVLELGWEALEHASVVPGTLAGSQVGVYVGAAGDDYARLQRDAVGHHSFTGLNSGMLANRLSYFLKLRGPSLAIDTAQSSSLVAVHSACAALRSGAASAALTAGVTLNLAPEGWLAMAKLRALSPDGQCFTFDARANGFVRGEGGAAVLLKRLEDAIADGDRIHAVIRGSAVNNDGGGRGLTVPDQQAQEEVLRLACADADVDPHAVQYVELHGTGTKVGDPVEAAALGTVLGAGRAPGDALHVGSVKTNIGHLESAAGIVGLVKVVASIGRRELPPSINFGRENPELSLSERNLLVRREHGPWPHADRPLFAGVSSFGLGGTNCHVVLSDGPVVDVPTETSHRALPWVLSGRTPEAVRAQAGRLLDHISAHGVPSVAAVGYSLATSRTAFEHRAVVVGADRAAELAAVRDGEPSALIGSAVDRGLAFLFPGQGSQRARAGAGLYQEFPVFAAAFDAICAELNQHLPRGVETVLFAEEGSADAALIDETLYTQTCLFALEVSLFRLFESWDLKPGYLLGHSIGELAAAHAADVFSLPDACALVAARGKLMQALPIRGAMISLQAGESEVRASLVDSVSIAAVNGPQATVISGDAAAVAEIAAGWAARGRKTRRLTVSHAFHSADMTSMLAEFEQVAARLTPRVPDIPLISNVTGRVINDEVFDPRYWARHVREAVRFADGVDSLSAAGVATFLEVGPGGALSAMARMAAEDRHASAFIPALPAHRDEAEAVMTAVGRLHLRGQSLDWDRLFGDAERVELPTYAFQRSRHWFKSGDDVPETAVVRQKVEPPSTVDDGVDVAQVVRSVAAAVLGHRDPAAVQPSRAFKDLGFDSNMLIELLDGVIAATGLRMPSTAVFDHPNAEELARYVELELTGGAPSRELVPAAAAVDEPIAIVGIACRFPGGVSSPDALWRLVSSGVDAVGDFPNNRGWDLDALYDPDPDAVGKSYTRRGGFLYDAGDFDAGFFGISPREALAMDPQQRLLLEVAWEAVEHAGVDPAGLRGLPVGVFVGATADEYGSSLHEPLDGFDGYQFTGSTSSVISGRVAYFLGLEGPAVTVDTACSSSLVALHLAVQSLRAGDCTMALAGGVMVMPHPGMFVEFSRQRGLAVDGRCKAFGAGADGTGWGEGVGVLLVQRLSDAVAEGRRILAVVRGSAVNQDGASNGLTAPNGSAQQRVIRAALAQARLAPGDVDVVEAHGTGTRLGDPIEAQALLATYGQDREGPLWLGSLKSNIGHTQAAAGVGGVIKMVMAMRHGVLPRTLHVDEPSPHVDWSVGSISLLTENQEWPDAGRPRRAGVSSFGISGTNAHVVLEAAELEADTEAGSGPGVWVLSAKSPEALRAQATRLAEYVRELPDSERVVADVGVSLLRRSRFEHRAVVTGADLDALLAGLDSVTDVAGRVVAGVDRGVVLVFPGQGSQWRGMGRELWESSSVFRDALQECARALDPLVGFSVVGVVRGQADMPSTELAGGGVVDRVGAVQPVLFAVMVALGRVWQSWGVRIVGVVGHSQGEIAAACVAGGLSLEDASRVVALRSRALRVLCGEGSMMSVSLPCEDVEKLALHWDGVGVAAVNGPATTVISGPLEGLQGVADECERQGVRARWIPVDYASHSEHVECIEARLLTDLADITPRGTEIPFYSTVTGERVDTAGLDAVYWYRNLRQTVLFSDTIESLARAGHRAFVEVSAHPVLVPALHDILGDTEAVVVGSLRRDEGSLDRLVRSAAEA